MKAWYLESHKSFYKLSLKIYYIKKFNSSLFYGELKFEIWTFKLLFSLNKKLNNKNHNSKYIENFNDQNPSNFFYWY